MSDYLANLVAKSRNAANVVQPRPASLFEPVTPAGFRIDDRGAGDVEFAWEERVQGDFPSDRPLATSTPLERAQARPPRIDIRSAAAAQPLAASLANDERRQHPATTLASSTAAPIAGTVNVSNSPVLLPPDRSGDAGARARTEPDSVLLPRTEPARSPTVISRERAVSMIGPAPRDRSAVSGEDAVPTIKISIGRVDVRAVMPPPAPRPAPARPGASLSLDDYLKHQRGRKR